MLKKYVRGLFSFTAIISLVLPFLGSWLWLHGRLLDARYDTLAEMAFRQEKHQLVIWKFSEQQILHELEWEHSREFRYQGEMYDIVKKEVQGDTTWFWCYHDRKETRIRKAMEDLMVIWLGGSPQKQQDQQRILDFFKTLFLTPGQEMDPSPIHLARSLNTGQSKDIPEFNILPHTPPPEHG